MNAFSGIKNEAPARGDKNIKAIIRKSARKDPAGVFFELLSRAIKTKPNKKNK